MLKYRNQLLKKSNFGREFGWDIVFDDELVAELVDPQSEDMFWDSYVLNICTQNSKLKKRLLSSEFWLNCNVAFRNKKLHEIAQNAFPATTPFTANGRLMVRGLYLLPDKKITTLSNLFNKLPLAVWYILLGAFAITITLLWEWIKA